MTSFSERIGVVAPSTALQIDSMSDELRNSIWNVWLMLYDEDDHWPKVAKYIAQFLRRTPTDELPIDQFDRVRNWVKRYFQGLEWYQVYDLIEFTVRNHRAMTSRSVGYGEHTVDHRFSTTRLMDIFNATFEAERSGYRFVQGVLAPITNEQEMAAIDEAASVAHQRGMQGAATHIQAAVAALSQKPTPNYRNAVAESIHAVESVAKQIAGEDATTLDPALKALAVKSGIHGALQSAFSKMYGYTSDADGIRHAILDEPTVDFAEAKYMVVSCSAFVHYLIQKADTAGLLKH